MIFARAVAMRLGMWAETIGILDENQAGFRKGRSTPDVVQVMARVQEDVEDGRRRVDVSERALCDVSPPRGAGGGGYAGVGGGTYCPPPQSRQRKRRPTSEESRSRRKTRRSRRPPSERWGKRVAALDHTLNQTKSGALRGPACGASR